MTESGLKTTFHRKHEPTGVYGKEGLSKVKPSGLTRALSRHPLIHENTVLTLSGGWRASSSSPSADFPKRHAMSRK